MAIRDPDVRRAVETIEDEFENLEATLKTKESEIEHLEETQSYLKAEIEDLKGRILELEEALAEAYLTSEADNERTSPEEQLEFQCGRSTDVSDSGNK